MSAAVGRAVHRLTGVEYFSAAARSKALVSAPSVPLAQVSTCDVATTGSSQNCGMAGAHPQP
ncbi:hypothetical protein [Arthrobacter sp. HLT1-20]